MQYDAFEIGQRAVLERMAAGAPLGVVLEALVDLVELQDPALMCSILILDGNTVRHGAAPKLPAAYVRAIDGAAIGPAAGSCGTAAFRREPVYVADIATDPLWADYRAFALPFGLRACWSTPIFSPTGDVLGTFAMYYGEPRLPDERARRWIAAATHLGAIALLRAREQAAAQRLEDELRAAERRRVFIADNIADVLFGVAVEADGRYRFTSVNPAFLRSTGLAEADVVGRRVDEVIPPASLPAVLAGYAAAIRSRQTVRWDETSEYPTGVRHGEVAVTPLFDGNGRCTDLVGTVRDITERKRAEQQIAAQAALLDAAHDAILVRGLDHAVRYWNAGAARLYGWSADEVVGRPADEVLYVEAERAAFAEATARTIADGAWSGELRHRTRDGRALEVECSWTLVRGADGAPTGILAINTDVTRKKQLEAQLVVAQRMESLATLAGGVAHDFNNLLSTIVASIELARRDAGDPVALGRRLDAIDRAAGRATALVRQILTFSRRRSGRRSVGSLWPVVVEVAELMRAVLPAMIELETRKDAEPLVELDAGHIHQVLMNLATNASHALGERGHLRFELAAADVVPAADGEPAVAGAFARLSVVDDGAGIDPAALPFIFEPFFTTREETEGTGLGLFVVQQLVRGHHGVVRVQSEAGKGTRFDLYFPVAQDAARTEPTPVPPVPRGDGERVLYLDDEQSLVTLATQLLATHGYEAVGVTNPARALQVLKDDPGAFDAVVTDYAMRGGTGIDLVQQLKGVDPALPVILVAGNPTPAMEADARRLGVRAVLPKPDFVLGLPAALARLFGR